MTAAHRVIIFDVEAERAAMLAKPLTALGYVPSVWSRPAEAAEILRRDSPSLAVVVEPAGLGGSFPGLVDAAVGRKIPTLGVVEVDLDPLDLVKKVQGYTGWVALSETDRELPARVVGLLDRPEMPSRLDLTPMIDHRFLALVIHDLRTPLNVIGLTIRAITHLVPQRSAELEEDLMFLQENAKQIEKMLSQLGDFCRLIEAEGQISALEFEPHRYLSDFLDDQRTKPEVGSKPVRLEFGDGSPAEVALDPIRVKLALQYALLNAINAAGDAPVRLRSRGGSGRWVVELIVDKPPPSSVESTELRPDHFERLTGTPQERRGLDLALVARVSRLFGGSTKLEIEPGRKSTVVIDWPERLEKS